MPVARISLRRGKPPAYLCTLSESIHKAMVDAFEVPPDDCFQVIHQHEADELIFNRRYLSRVSRSDDFLLIAITAGRLRSTDVKRSFYRRLTECLADKPGIAASDVMVIITTTQGEDWSFAEGVAAPDLPAQ